jgi:hypothetical protein
MPAEIDATPLGRFHGRARRRRFVRHQAGRGDEDAGVVQLPGEETGSHGTATHVAVTDHQDPRRRRDRPQQFERATPAHRMHYALECRAQSSDAALPRQKLSHHSPSMRVR